MIKVVSFKFASTEREHGWADFAKFGPCTQCDSQLYRDFRESKFHLDTESSWQISMDQSTTCTGLFVKNYDNSQAYMIEVSRQKGSKAEDYVFDLEMFLHQFCEGCVITHLIYERPISNENYRSSQVLFQLEGMIQTLHRRYEEFKPARLENIENSSWRRVVIQPEFSHLQRKKASEQSVIKLFGWPGSYGGSLGGDLDVYEAVGVMFGWFFNSFDTLGRPYVRGDRFYGNIGGFILPTVSAEEVCEEFKKAGLDSIWLVQNPRKSIFENLACAVDKGKVVCVELTELSAMLALTVECGIKWMNPDKMAVILVASNFVDRRLFDITGDVYHFVI